jgi:nicotinate-nucleotide adenylyltransferase
MAEAAVSDFGARVTVSDIEREVGGESRTIHTLNALRARFPSDRFSLLIGADLLNQVDRWKSWDEIRSGTDIYVVGREGVGFPAHSFPVMLPEVSSTDIRRAVAGGDLPWLLPRIPRAVLALIERDGLYR